MKVTAVGDCGIDRYVDTRVDRPGGVSLNFATNAQHCFEPGDRIGVVTALGDDREGEIVGAAITRFGLDATIAWRRGATPVQYIDLDAFGERHFVRYEPGVLAEHRMTAGDRATIAASDVVIATVFNGVVAWFESVLTAPAPGLRALDFCNLGTIDDPLDFVRRYAGHFDVCFAGISAEDRDVQDELERVARTTGRLIVATLGPAGSVALGGPQRIRCAAVSVPRVVDTTGAGDSFAAGFLSRFARTGDVAAALRRDSEVAAVNLGETGAFPADLIPWPVDAPAEWSEQRAS